MPFLSKSHLDLVFGGRRQTNSEASRQLRERSIKSFSSDDRFHIFLSHSFLDADYVLRLCEVLEGFGYQVFVDWIVNPEFDRSRVTKETANELRRAMNQSESLLFAVSDNSPNSAWMPWELGYSDGLHGKVAIMPIYEAESADETFKAREYLSLYPYITINRNARGDVLFVVNEAIDKFVSLDDWLSGVPFKQYSLFTKALRERFGTI